MTSNVNCLSPTLCVCITVIYALDKVEPVHCVFVTYISIQYKV